MALTPSEIMFYSGIIVLVVGIVVLLISGLPSYKKRTIYKDYPFTGFNDTKIKPFRIQEKGKLTCTLSNLEMSGGTRIFLTDLFPSIYIDYTWGPRYFEIKNPPQQPEPVDLGRGEYAFVVDGKNSNTYQGEFSMEFEYQVYPRERLADWGLALMLFGSAMALVGFAM